MPEPTVQLGRRTAFAYLIVADGEQSGAIHQLRPGTCSIGRAGSNEIRLDDPSVSNEHARIRWEGDSAITLIDLGSENGTRVNGRRTQQHALRHNDVVLAGETRLVFKYVGIGG